MPLPAGQGIKPYKRFGEFAQAADSPNLFPCSLFCCLRTPLSAFGHFDPQGPQPQRGKQGRTANGRPYGGEGSRDLIRRFAPPSPCAGKALAGGDGAAASDCHPEEAKPTKDPDGAGQDEWQYPDKPSLRRGRDPSTPASPSRSHDRTGKRDNPSAPVCALGHLPLHRGGFSGGRGRL